MRIPLAALARRPRIASSFLFFIALSKPAFIAPAQASPSLLDIGLNDTESASVNVLYLDAQDSVRLRPCSVPVEAPADRNCALQGLEKTISAREFFAALPYDSGAYSRDARGLAQARANLEAARSAQAAGAVERLERVVASLEKIENVRAHLGNGNNVALFEFETEALPGVSMQDLLRPFSAGGPAPACTDFSGSWQVCGTTKRLLLVAQDSCAMIEWDGMHLNFDATGKATATDELGFPFVFQWNSKRDVLDFWYTGKIQQDWHIYIIAKKAADRIVLEYFSMNADIIPSSKYKPLGKVEFCRVNAR